MATPIPYIRTRATAPNRQLLAGLGLMGLALLAVAFAGFMASGIISSFPYLYLLPWVLGLALVLATPSLILWHRGTFTLYNPIVFATWSYFFPAFVLGGVILAFGWSQPYFLSFIQDADSNLPFTIVLVGVGFAALSIGFFVRIGARIGALIERLLPVRDYDTSSLVVPGLVLLVLGIMNSILALVLGIIGYQKVAESGAFDGLIFLTTQFWLMATFLLWLVIFARRHFDFLSWIMMGLLLVTSLTKALLSGNRGGLVQVVLVIAMAFLFSGRKVTVKHGIFAAVGVVVCLIAGMIYGTTFRIMKGSESQSSLGSYTSNVLDTFDYVGKNNNLSTLEFGLMSLAERVDAVSSVGVVVSNYEQLKPYEEGYGLDDNIWKDTVTFLVPRFIWKDKPVASDPRKFSELYFDMGDNSFTITPIGDLLRNYGVIGIPIGMFILGVVLRTIYRSLIEDQPLAVPRVTLYFMLITAVSYESFYGSIIPYLFKIGVISVAGLLLVNFLARSKRQVQYR
jgi:hypothetical protein